MKNMNSIGAILIAILLVAATVGCKRDTTTKPVAVKVTDAIPVSITHIGTNFVTVTNTVNVIQTNTITLTNTVTVTVTNTVTETNVVTVTNTVATQAAPVTPPGPNVIAVVTSGDTNIVFYDDGSVSSTNAPVGMVNGFPVLIDNVSRKTVTLVLKRVAKPGSITLEVENGNYLTVQLLQGQYNCTWRMKGQYQVTGSCTMTVSDGPPTDLVVGKGVFNGTLTLVDR